MGAASDLRDGAASIAGDQPMLHPSLAAALVAALAELTVVNTGREVNAGQYSYKYASLPDVVEMTRPVLQKHGLVALTPVHDHGTGLACTVKIVHTSGEHVDLGPLPFPHGRDAQATGSMITYHRRYALIAALGMATGEDDDGAAAKARTAPSGPSAAAVDALALLDDLPNEVGDRLAADLVARAGAGSPLLALEDEGWRNWFLQAIEHHKAKEVA